MSSQEYSQISDRSRYVERMEKSMMDKLFFVDKIESDVLVDFGCGTGTLLGHVYKWMPGTTLVGYEKDPHMIEDAKGKFSILDGLFSFHQFWEEIEIAIKKCKEKRLKTAIVLSSVIHEVYHYSEPSEIDVFWKRIFESGFDFIVIRDMVPSRTIDRPSDMTDVSRIYSRFLHTQALSDFQNAWGSVENNRHLTHFLLKYKYTEPNWDREVKENYFPLFREDLMAKIPPKYRVMYHEHYVLPFIRRTVKDDFGIELKDPTHLKLILEME